MKRLIYAGDSYQWSIPLSWDHADFTPDESWTLILTGKRSLDDPDFAAVFQKASGAGISTDGNRAIIDLVSADTDGQESGVIYCDIRGQHDTLGRRTLAVFTVYVSQPVTREDQSSVPIHTTEPPVPGNISLEAILTILGTPSYENLAAANAALPIGRPYYDQQLGTLNITTA